MADYSYIAIEKSGKEIKGSMESDSREKVEQKLRSQGCIPLEIKEQNALQKDIKIGVGKKVKTRDLSVFCRQFVSMLRAGVSIVEALDMLSIQTENKTLSQAIREVRTEIGKGSTLSEAMEKQNKVFPPMLVNIIAFQPNIMPAAAISLMSPPPMALPLDNRYSRYKKALTAKKPMT